MNYNAAYGCQIRYSHQKDASADWDRVNSVCNSNCGKPIYRRQPKSLNIVNTALINEVVFAEGGDAPIEVIIYRENLETNRIRAEYLELQDQRYKSQQQDGVISREERRRLCYSRRPEHDQL